MYLRGLDLSTEMARVARDFATDSLNGEMIKRRQSECNKL